MKSERKPSVALEAVWAGMVPLIVLVAGVWLRFGLPAPKCAWHSLTGMPCLTCGMSRGTVLFLRGDWERAFYFNPLALVAPFVLFLFWAYCVLAVMGKVRPLGAFQISARGGKVLRWGVLVLLLCNWGYLLSSEKWRAQESEKLEFSVSRGRVLPR